MGGYSVLNVAGLSPYLSNGEEEKKPKTKSESGMLTRSSQILRHIFCGSDLKTNKFGQL